ncbi:MAG TPA: DUF3443 family protein [Gallionella sp.]|nr:DUF3443 family protein [Gallionella sp.]
MTYTVGATVTGLNGSTSVVLQNNGGSDLTFNANGTANFSATMPSGFTYDVTVLTQPTGETCTVTNGKGTVTNANVVASITCSQSTYTIGGAVSGLSGSQVTLLDNGGNNTPISANGSFVFSTPIANGSAYSVTVGSQPSGQTCWVTYGSGTVSSANITNVAVVCSSAASTYSVSAIVTGLLSNTSVVLQDNSADNLTFTANGTANFSTTLSNGSTYHVTVLTQPTGETCTVTNGSGTISGANVTVSVACASTAANNPAGTASVTPTTVPTLPTPGNVIPLVVDAGPVAGRPGINVGFVSVTVCTPGTSGTTAACQTIDHVVLDTGSYGLRLLNSQLSSSLNLPAATNVSNHAVGECLQFVIGTTWGSVRLADVYVGGEVARSIPIHDIGDHPAGYSGIPTDCTGQIQDTQTALGANGILGVGLFVKDCDACLTQVIPATYYNCTASGCTGSTVTASQVVKNPVAEFQNPVTGVVQDNNGEKIILPAVGSGGSTGITGSVTFGIGTQTNNALSGTVYPTDVYGNFITDYQGTNNLSAGTFMSSSFLDSGSNGFFFKDNTIATCADGWYCPSPSPLTLYATNSGYTGSPRVQTSFSLVYADTLFNLGNIVAGNVGAPISIGSFDWGLPFFYGRTVFVAISGKSTSGGVGPYWAY